MTKFKENANMFHIAGMEAPIIHGHTRIDLCDVKTGKRERIENDNTFMANNLAKYVRSLGYCNNSPYTSDVWSGCNMVRNFCGGVLLFKDAIPDDSEYMNAGNKMTANGCYNIVNNGNPPEFGSWNSIESNIDGNSSAVLVWDWSTSQGNGQISSVCLTSETGGHIGYGNPSGYAMSTKKNAYVNQPTRNKGAKLIHNNLSYVLSYASSTKTLTLTISRLPITRASIFDKMQKRTVNIDLTSYNVGNIDFIHFANPNKIVCYKNANTNNNTGMNLLIVDLDDFSVVKKTIMNTTGSAWSNGNIWFNYDKNYLCVQQTVSGQVKFYLIDADTGSIVKTIDKSNSPSSGWSCLPKEVEDGVYFSHNLYDVIDVVNGTHYITNAENFVNWQNYIYNKEYDAMMYGYDDYNGNRIVQTATTLVKNPLYLATINNLQNSVTKQNTQTMKVTYTLTEV